MSQGLLVAAWLSGICLGFSAGLFVGVSEAKVSADATPVNENTLSVAVKLDVRAKSRQRVKVEVGGCGHNLEVRSCGPASKVRTVRLHRGRNRVTVRLRVSRMEYEPVPDGVLLRDTPWEQGLVPAQTDRAWVQLRDQLLFVEPAADAVIPCRFGSLGDDCTRGVP